MSDAITTVIIVKIDKSDFFFWRHLSLTHAKKQIDELGMCARKEKVPIGNLRVKL